jgi:acyl carrier protein
VPLLRTSLFEQVITPGDLPGAGAVDLRSAIEALGDTDAVDLVTWHLSRELAAILRAPADEIDRQRPMSELGLDSLMVVELRLAVAHHLGIDLPLASIGDDTSLSTLAVTALAALRSGPLAAGPATFALESDLAQKHLDVPLEHAALVHASQAIDRRAAANERVIQ